RPEPRQNERIQHAPIVSLLVVAIVLRSVLPHISFGQVGQRVFAHKPLALLPPSFERVFSVTYQLAQLDGVVPSRISAPFGRSSYRDSPFLTSKTVIQDECNHARRGDPHAEPWNLSVVDDVMSLTRSFQLLHPFAE